MSILECHSVLSRNIVFAKDCHLYDEDNIKILDFEAGIWCMGLGHTNLRINEAIRAQIDRVIHLNHRLISKEAKYLADDLLDLVCLKKGSSVFLSSGSEAVQLGIRLANLANPGDTVVFKSSYLAAYNLQQQHKSWVSIDYENCNNCQKNKCSNSCRILTKLKLDNIKNFLFEPATCGKVSFPPKKLVNLIYEKVKKNNGVVLANEVTTGFGRTGKWFGYQHYNLKPDIVTLGKALGNGYPISAVLISSDITKKIIKSNFVYVQSHQNDPLGCKIAREVISIYKNSNIIENVKLLESIMASKLKSLEELDSVKKVRGKGLMWAVTLVDSVDCIAISNLMLERNVLVGVTEKENLIRLYPPLIVSNEEIYLLISTLKKVLSEYSD